MFTRFVRWTSLNGFHEVVKNLQYNRLHQTLLKNNYQITYGLKIKLHGTNAAVRVAADGKVTAQKRNGDLGPEADNAGFRAWVEANERYFENLALSAANLIIYGEWAGPGVQSNVAVSNIPHKTFFVFAVDKYFFDGSYQRIYDPQLIAKHIDERNMPDDVVVIPWYDTITIDFASRMTTEATLAKLNLETEKVGLNDPLIEELFNVKGCGEGFVCYPFLGEDAGFVYHNTEIEHFSHFNFKAKSEHHRVNKTLNAVNFNPEKFANKNRFADSFCTEQRMEQGWQEMDAERIMQNTPKFIGWVCADVFKESKTEQVESGLDWKDLSKVVATRAAIWFKQKVTGSF